MCFRSASGYTEDVVQVFGLLTVGDEVTLTYKIEVLDGARPAKAGPWALTSVTLVKMAVLHLFAYSRSSLCTFPPKESVVEVSYEVR
jgi:hypothetical protein